MSTEPGAQYLARYAEPEAQLASSIGESYSACLVVPVHGEAPSLLEGFRAALAAAPGRVLFILVVNAADSASAETHGCNQRLLSELEARFPERRALEHAAVQSRAQLGHAASHDVLWLDRARPGARLPERDGVGGARKLGADLAVALWARGRIACPRIASSDADVTLPSDYFTTLTRAVDESVRSAAWLWPFQHESGGDAQIDTATTLYEISLRYYVLGLAAARSPYAYHSIGSTLCVDAQAYSSVRGFPKRVAAEDFYLLDKLAKVGPLRRLPATPLRIRSRASDRVPFGTGRRAQEIARDGRAGGEFQLYSPNAFRALQAVICGLDEFAACAEPAALQRALVARVPELADAACQALGRLGVFEALRSAATRAPPGNVLRRRVHTWFDALRTLRFIHGMRELALPSLPWRTALASAEFLPGAFRQAAAFRGEPKDGSLEQVCQALAQLEAALPAQVGPALL